MRLSQLASLAATLVLVLPATAAAEPTREPVTASQLADAPRTTALPPAVRQAIAETEPAALEELAEATSATSSEDTATTKVADGAMTARDEVAAMTAAGGAMTARDELVARTATATAMTASEGAEAMKAPESAETRTVTPTATTAASAPAPDPAIAGLLAELDGTGKGRAASGDTNPTVAGGVGVNPMARASVAFVLGLIALLGLLAHPRTRGHLIERLKKGAGARRVKGGPCIEVQSAAALGAGQKVITLEVDGVRLLVGLSQGRMDVLHTWSGGETGTAAAAVAESPLGASLQALYGADALAPTGAAQAPAAQEQPTSAAPAAKPAPSPSANQLLTAWSRAAKAAPPTVEPLADEPELPWWMEGATDQERCRLVAQAAEDGQDEATVAESVLASLRAARSVSGPDAPAPRLPRRPRLASLGEAREHRIEQPREQPREEAPRPRAPRTPRLVLGLLFGLAVTCALGYSPDAMAGDASLSLDLGSEAIAQVVDGDAGASTAVKLLVTLTLLAVAPALVLSMTSFTRLIVVFSLMRQAIGVQQAPPNQVLIGLALFLTWFVMAPTFNHVNDIAVEPYFEGALTEGEALTEAMGPMRDFMLRHTREKDLALFLRMSDAPRPETRDDVATRALVPAFMISELKTAFQIGFLIYIPFLIIDLVVATVLLAMGMMVLPPIVISLPFKLLLFVFVDGWNLLVGSMVTSFA
jgi:flagellar biosynthesis protein FliP